MPLLDFFFTVLCSLLLYLFRVLRPGYRFYQLADQSLSHGLHYQGYNLIVSLLVQTFFLSISSIFLGHSF